MQLGPHSHLLANPSRRLLPALSRRAFLGQAALLTGGLAIGGTIKGGFSPVAAATPMAAGDGLALTPPMGWNSWNCFGAGIDEDLIRETANAMVSTGLKRAGYQYLIIDDGWATDRGDDGVLMADPDRFPGGIKALSDYVHGLGLKIGIYTDAGTNTCEGWPGSYESEEIDVATFASWKIDYLKIDWCNTEDLDPYEQYSKYWKAAVASGRPMVISLCDWGYMDPWEWGPKVGHLWRTTGDIEDNWDTMIDIMDSNSRSARFAAPGGWNDPDMLEVGNGGMTGTEYRTHFSMWAMMAAPLIAGNDLRSMSLETREILTNQEVIAIDQDPAGIHGTKVRDDYNGLQVWVKPLQAKGSYAVAFLNRRPIPALIKTHWEDLGIKPGSALVRDLWLQKDIGNFPMGFGAEVPAHGVVLIKVSG
jgi:alpha-galactosidase